MSEDSTAAVPPTEAAMREAWTEVCMMEYRITGDMMKATACADRIEKIYRDNVRAEVLAEAIESLGLDTTVPGADPAKRLLTLKYRVNELEQRSDLLGKLETAGVDNWEGYCHALRDDEEDEDWG